MQKHLNTRMFTRDCLVLYAVALGVNCPGKFKVTENLNVSGNSPGIKGYFAEQEAEDQRRHVTSAEDSQI